MSAAGDSGNSGLLQLLEDRDPAAHSAQRTTLPAPAATGRQTNGAGTARMRRQYIVSLTQILGAIGLAAAVLSFSGQVMAANRNFGYLPPRIVKNVRGRLRFGDATAGPLLREALQQCRDGNRNGAHAVSIRSGRGEPSAVARIIALPKVTRGEAFDGAAALLIIAHNEEKSSAPNQQQLQRLFGLSPAEARVALAVAAGKTLKTIASDFEVSRETVRSQLKMALAKTGVKRQLDLAVLLASVH